MKFTHPSLGLRPIADTDRGFLLKLYATTREEELKLTTWSDEEKQLFVQMQFAAQHKAYSQYSDSAFFVVLHDQQPIGRIYLQYRETALLIVDLSLLPAWRGQGIGTCLLEAAFRHASETHRSAVQIHLENFNPALHLYHRLGFRQIEDKGVYLFMEWQQPLAAGMNAAADAPGLVK